MSQRNRVTFMAQLAMVGVVILLAPIPVAGQGARHMVICQHHAVAATH